MASIGRRLLPFFLAFSAMTGADAAPPADPNVWLENIFAPDALGWVETENKRTLGILEADTRYAGLYADALRIAEATDRIPMPNLLGERVVNLWQDATHVQGIWRQTTLPGYLGDTPQWRTLIDLDQLSAAEGRKWVWKGEDCEPTAERRCLIALSEGGEDAVTVREFDLDRTAFVDGGFTLPTSKQDLAWETPDSLLVARDWGQGSMTTSGYPYVVKRLTRGQPLDQARELFRGKPGDVGVGPLHLMDGQDNSLLLIERNLTFFEGELFVVEGDRVAKLDLPAKYRVYGLASGRLILRINQDWQAYKSGSLVAVRIAGGKITGSELLFAPNARQSVDGVAVTQGHVVAAIYDNVRGQAWSFTPGDKGWTARRIPLPDNSSVGLVNYDRRTDQLFVRAESFTAPTTLWLADAAAATARQAKTMPARFNAEGLVTEQYEAVSKDGTRIPYFIVHRADARKDGSTPALMTAYGGFQVSMTPTYQAIRGKLWLEKGGAFVLANIRGGGEFGPAWHDAGLKTKRQVIYDDFAAVAEDLVRRGFTSARRLGIFGGSNGGLLMGVEMTQRPDLWHAVAIQIPLLDMLRYEQLSAGSSWVGEYGSMTVPAERAFWEKTSPYQQLRRGADYPEPFIWTTTRDDRVGPVQARKFAARMKDYGLPYLYWENTEGGHAAGANLKQSARTNALEITYFTRKLMD
ncbi:prolyl oligopeptidase family serine peptidase [uncultured Sphingomonas sp.]|uniref:prolyl oligopeptidase family serine peptidase n=1 Tax=uncultured Sphingomonas sp. TaxID=158754 RepID=UPI0025CB81D7|nr:prolyl oligopeptidase family serine peptidase [uncultured Sphingomonas sp.]